MKKSILFILLAACPLHADPPRFAITSSTTDAGGNRAESPSLVRGDSPRFVLTGTIGQPDAAPQLAGPSRFALQPGFWNDYHAVQTPGAPQLVIRKGPPGFVVLAWPVSVEGFALQQSPDLTPESWTTVVLPVIDTDTEHTVTVPINAPRMFFSLKAL